MIVVHSLASSRSVRCSCCEDVAVQPGSETHTVISNKITLLETQIKAMRDQDLKKQVESSHVSKRHAKVIIYK